MEEIEIENAKIMVIFGCERFSTEATARHTVLIQIESNTNIDPEKWREFLENSRSRKNCKIILGGKNMSEGKVVIIDFYADWCGPCRLQDPIMEELKKKFDGNVEFKKIDVDKDYELASKYGIHAIPTIVVEKDGNVLNKHVGVTNAKILEGNIKDAMGMK